MKRANHTLLISTTTLDVTFHDTTRAQKMWMTKTISPHIIACSFFFTADYGDGLIHGMDGSGYGIYECDGIREFTRLGFSWVHLSISYYGLRALCSNRQAQNQTAFDASDNRRHLCQDIYISLCFSSLFSSAFSSATHGVGSLASAEIW